MEAKLKNEKKNKTFWYPTRKRTGPGRMAQTPRVVTGDSVGRFCRYNFSTLINCISNLSMCGTFLLRFLPPPDICELMPTPKQKKEKSLSKVPSSIWLFRIPTAIFVYKNWYNLGSLLSPW